MRLFAPAASLGSIGAGAVIVECREVHDGADSGRGGPGQLVVAPITDIHNLSGGDRHDLEYRFVRLLIRLSDVSLGGEDGVIDATCERGLLPRLDIAVMAIGQQADRAGYQAVEHGQYLRPGMKQDQILVAAERLGGRSDVESARRPAVGVRHSPQQAAHRIVPPNQVGQGLIPGGFENRVFDSEDRSRGFQPAEAGGAEIVRINQSMEEIEYDGAAIHSAPIVSAPGRIDRTAPLRPSYARSSRVRRFCNSLPR